MMQRGKWAILLWLGPCVVVVWGEGLLWDLPILDSMQREVLGVSHTMLGESESIKSSSNASINTCVKSLLTLIDLKNDMADKIKK